MNRAEQIQFQNQAKNQMVNSWNRILISLEYEEDLKLSLEQHLERNCGCLERQKLKTSIQVKA